VGAMKEWFELNMTSRLTLILTSFSHICCRQKMNTALPILTEVVKEEVEVSDTGKSSNKHVCFLVCVNWKLLFQSIWIYLNFTFRAK